MILHKDISDEVLYRLLKGGKIMFGGNVRLKIFGCLNCSSGKRMLRKNRVFFESEQEVMTLGYRPCGCCMGAIYRQWKIGSNDHTA